MPSVRYFNQTAPFWDFVASMEEQGTSHPMFGATNRGESSENENNEHSNNPWVGGWGGFPWEALPHRGRHGPHGAYPPPPPPPPQDGSAPPPPPEGGEGEGPSDPEGGPSDDPNQGGPHGRRGRHGHHHHHPFGRGGRHGMGPRGPHFRGRGRPPFHPYGFGPFGPMADMFRDQFFGAEHNNNNNNNNNNATGARNNEDFTPEVDVFDASEAFVIHVSLAGAKKEDIAVSWDADKSELSISGVVHRPGDEELLKTIALDERKVGAFERKVRLGSRANPAQVDIDGIVAKMEDGVLRVEVPKLDAGYVEVKKVDIE